MNKQEFVAIAIRLFAIALAIYALTKIPSLVSYFVDNHLNEEAYIFLGILLFLFIISTFLWFFPLTVVSSILPKTKPKEKITHWDQEDLIECGFIILGVYFLFNVISDAVVWYFFLKFSASQSYPISLNAEQMASIYATVVEFIVTLFLLFGAKSMAKFILKIRYAGSDKNRQGT